MISWQLTLLQTLRVCPRCRRLLSIHEIQHGRIITAPARLQPLRATGAPWQGAGGASGAGQGGRSRGAGGGHTGEQVKKEGAGLPGIGCLLGHSWARPSWRVPSPPALGLNHQNSAANNNSAASGHVHQVHQNTKQWSWTHPTSRPSQPTTKGIGIVCQGN